MKEITHPIRLSQIIRSMRLSLDASYCLNPSMAHLAARHTQVVCQVRYVIPQDGGGYRVEGVDCKLYDFPGDMTVTELIQIREPIDSAKPGLVGVSKMFNGVSIQ